MVDMGDRSEKRERGGFKKQKMKSDREREGARFGEEKKREGSKKKKHNDRSGLSSGLDCRTYGSLQDFVFCFFF